MEFFFLKLIDDGQFDVEALIRQIESFPLSVRHPDPHYKGSDAHYILCVGEGHKRQLETALKSNPHTGAYEGYIALRRDCVTVNVYAQSDSLTELAKAVVPIMKQYRCRIVDDRGHDYTERYKDNPEQLFEDLINPWKSNS